MKEIERYLLCNHRFNGRGPDEYDCWGQVREVRALVFGKPWLPSYGGVHENDVRALTEAGKTEAAKLREVDPIPGAFATVWRGQLMVHVGIVVEVDERLMVLDTNMKTGPRLQNIADFEREYLKVVYYD